MTRSGFLSGLAAVVASPRAAADFAASAAVDSEARAHIAAADAKFVAAVETALFGGRCVATEAGKQAKAMEAAK